MNDIKERYFRIWSILLGMVRIQGRLLSKANDAFASEVPAHEARPTDHNNAACNDKKRQKGQKTTEFSSGF